MAYGHALLRYLGISIREGGETMTKIEAENILKERAGLDAYTIQFLGAYKYGEELMVKLEKAMQ